MKLEPDIHNRFFQAIRPSRKEEELKDGTTILLHVVDGPA